MGSNFDMRMTHLPTSLYGFRPLIYIADMGVDSMWQLRYFNFDGFLK